MEKEKVLMMIHSKRGHTVEPVGVLHLKEGDELGVWDWVKERARESRESRESLERKWGPERFVFPYIPEYV